MIKAKTSEKKLNKEQKEAVNYFGGPLLIVAGAGTGKTTVVAERIKKLILEQGVKPSEILALTFTEKAAREMEERVDVALPYGYTQMWISTFHSFCDRILRREALHIGLDPRYKLMTQAETIQFIRTNLFKFDLEYFRPLGNPTKFIGALAQHISRLQDEDIEPKQYLEFAKKTLSDSESKAKWLELASAYKTYEELKVKEGVADYGDLITKTLKLFRERPNVLKEYQNQFKHILVDEFQDTNIAQYELIKLLAPLKKNPNLAVVGDDSQSIYKFRGAAISNILHFKKDYKNAKTVVLLTNYRSTQEILDRAYSLIKHNDPDTLEAKLGISKNLVSAVNKSGDKVRFFHVDRVENEAEKVATEIGSLVKEGYQWKDIAILVRANNHSEPFMRALSQKGIPYQFLGPGRLFRESEVLDLISYLKVLYNFEDSTAFFRLLSADFFNFDARDLAALGIYARKNNISLFEAAEKAPELKLSDESKSELQKIIGVIHKHLGLIKKDTAGQILYFFLEEFDLLPRVFNPESEEAEKKAANVSKFFDKLKSYEADHKDSSVFTVVDWIDLSMDLGESPLSADTDWNEVNAVNILTVHGSKGLEFPVVFLVNLISQRFPSLERREAIPIPDEIIKEDLPSGDYHIQEERRLFYVGMTRAKEKLYFTVADYYGEGKRDRKLSPFIFEALGDESIHAEKDKVTPTTLSAYASPQVLSKVSAKKPFHIDYLSYSQIETFKVCPLHYKLRYILNVPTAPSSSQSLGIAIHESLRDLYENAREGRKATKATIQGALQNNWKKEGYKNKKHEEKAFEKAKNYLEEYFEKEFDPNVTPSVMEQPFVIPLRKGGEQPLKIGGKIDRVDVLADGKIEIVDYKTGANIPTQKAVDHDMQLTFYALAATALQDAPFGKDPSEVKLTLYYFDGAHKLTTTRSSDQLHKAVEDIFKVRQEIEKSEFSCSKSFICRDCEYKLLCSAE